MPLMQLLAGRLVALGGRGRHKSRPTPPQDQIFGLLGGQSLTLSLNVSSVGGQGLLLRLDASSVGGQGLLLRLDICLISVYGISLRLHVSSVGGQSLLLRLDASSVGGQGLTAASVFGNIISLRRLRRCTIN